MTVPKTASGLQGEQPLADRKSPTEVREVGKIAPYVCKKVWLWRLKDKHSKKENERD